MDALEPGVEVLGPAKGKLLYAVNESVEAADHLKPSDGASIELARQFAQIIDEAIESGDPERIHQVSCVAMPTLNKTLTSLGLNPEGRFKMKIGLTAGQQSGPAGPPKAGAPDELTALRAKRAKRGGA